MGILSLDSTIFELCESNPELVGILKKWDLKASGIPS